MDRPSIRQLESLVAVADAKSFRKIRTARPLPDVPRRPGPEGVKYRGAAAPSLEKSVLAGEVTPALAARQILEMFLAAPGDSAPSSDGE